MMRRDIIAITVVIIFVLAALVSSKFYFDDQAVLKSEEIVSAISKQGVMGEPGASMKYLIEMFRSETDTMIYKATVWVGVWMTIFAAILILPTLHQMHEQRDSREEVRKHLSDLDKERLKLSEDTKSRISELDCAIEEIRISHIMTCISNIPDPLLLKQSKSFPLVKTYLKMLYHESVRFENLIGRMQKDYQEGRNKRIEEEMPYVRLVIVEILTSISKSQIVFHDADLNFEFFETIRVAHSQFEHICAGVFDVDLAKISLNAINQSFGKLINQIEAQAFIGKDEEQI